MEVQRVRVHNPLEWLKYKAQHILFDRILQQPKYYTYEQI